MCKPLKGKLKKLTNDDWDEGGGYNLSPSETEFFRKRDVKSAVEGFKKQLLSSCYDYDRESNKKLIEKWFEDVIE